MSLGNQIKSKKKTETNKLLVEKTITLTVNDWNIVAASLGLLAECVGKLGLPTENVGTVYTNCTVLSNLINEKIK